MMSYHLMVQLMVYQDKILWPICRIGSTVKELFWAQSAFSPRPETSVMQPENGGKFKILKFRERYFCSYDMTLGSHNGIEDKYWCGQGGGVQKSWKFCGRPLWMVPNGTLIFFIWTQRPLETTQGECTNDVSSSQPIADERKGGCVLRGGGWKVPKF